MPPLSQALSSEMFLRPSASLFLKGHGHAPAQRLEDLVAGDERAGREAGGEVRGEAGEPGGHEDALQAALGIDEALGGVYENPALGDESSVLVVDFSIAPVGLGGHRLEEAGAAEWSAPGRISWPCGP